MTEPPKEPDEFEKRILAAVEKIDAFAMVDVIISLLKAYGDFAKTMGDIQKRSPEAYEVIIEAGKVAPEVLSKIAAKSPPAVIGTYVQVSLKLFGLQEKMSKLMELNPDEKIQLGNELIEIANTYEQVIAEVRKQIEGTE